jgi:hypothetical protein
VELYGFDSSKAWTGLFLGAHKGTNENLVR